MHLLIWSTPWVIVLIQISFNYQLYKVHHDDHHRSQSSHHTSQYHTIFILRINVVSVFLHIESSQVVVVVVSYFDSYQWYAITLHSVAPSTANAHMCKRQQERELISIMLLRTYVWVFSFISVLFNLLIKKRTLR